MMVNQAALETAKLVNTLFQGYYPYSAALTIAKDDRVKQLMPQILPGQIVPVGEVKRKDGTGHSFDFSFYLGWIKSNNVIINELERIWFTGSLLRLGDVLKEHRYFDRAPELELIRHLRNGVAHGNCFRIDKRSNLINYPAHNKLAEHKN